MDAIFVFILREIPAWEVTYNIKPSEYAQSHREELWIQRFNVERSALRTTPQGFQSITLRDVPVFKPEPRMPLEDSVRPWILMRYWEGSERKHDKRWARLGKILYKRIKREMKIDRVVRKKARELTAGLATSSEKIDRILKYCLDEITNVYHDRWRVPAEERRKMKLPNKPADTLRLGAGLSHDVRMLFVALLKAAGMQAHVAYCAGRYESFYQYHYFLDPYDWFFSHRRLLVAVELNGKWKFYNPASPYLEPGMFDWRQDGTWSLILHPKKLVFVQIPLSDPSRSQILRRARFKLQEDGTLVGSVEQVYRGHFGVSRKRRYDLYTERVLERAIEDQVRERLSRAEISDIEVENVTAIREPLTVRYRIRVPGYAQEIDEQMLLQPAFFRMNVAPEFVASQRRYDFDFKFPWSESDEVTIELPEKYELETNTAPESRDLGSLGRYEAGMGQVGDNRSIYRRSFRFGDNGSVMIRAAAYPQIKRIFDFVHQQDNHVVTLIPKAPAEISGQAPN